MRNNIMLKLDSIIEVSIKGKNINNYIKRIIIKNNIDIIKLTYISYKEINIITKYSDYLKLIKYKSIYRINIINRRGIFRWIDIISKNFILSICIIMMIIFIYILSNFIFSIDVIYNKDSVRKMIYEELDKYGINKYSMKKSYKELESIEDEILNNNKDTLEWIEIVESGTKYIVRLEERKINNIENNYSYQHIVTSKDCVLYQINAFKGEKVKSVNQYLSKGEIVISGNITKPDGTIIKSMASGNILGEVWYSVTVNYPYTYYEERLTGKSKKVLVFNILNKSISLFQFNPYHSFKKDSKIIFKNNILDISLSLEKEYELNIISNIYTYDEAINKAIDTGIEKLIKDNDKIIKIKDKRILESYNTDDGVKIKLFIKAIEDVTEILEIYE